MITTQFFTGQGLGNQLFNYVTTRCLALDKGYEFGIEHPERFKGYFLDLDMGDPVLGGITPVEGKTPSKLPDGINNYYKEEVIIGSQGSRSPVDANLLNIQDNTSVHGLMQAEEYFEHRKDEIREWLKPEYLRKEDCCIINFRGGEYKWRNDFFLPQTYWNNAINYLLLERPDMKFRVVTDDVEEAKKFFPQYPISHDMEDDYISIMSSEYLILSNSTFAFFPAWLNTNMKKIIAPKYFGNFNANDGNWSLLQNIYRGWHYMDLEGNIEVCKS